MKREIGYKVMIKLSFIVVVVIFSFLVLNYNRLETSLFNQYTTITEAEAKIQES